MLTCIYKNEMPDQKMVYAFLSCNRCKSVPEYGTIQDFYSYLLNVCNLTLGEVVDLIDDNTGEIIRSIKVGF